MKPRIKTIAEREWNSNEFDIQCEKFIAKIREAPSTLPQSIKITFQAVAGQPDCIWLVCFIEWVEQ